MNIEDEFKEHLNGVRNIFYGLLQGIDNKINIDTPNFIYHYTTIENLESILDSETIRFYTVENFSDEYERKLLFSVENRAKGIFTDNISNIKYDIRKVLNKELSSDFIFIQSSTISHQNKYLWKEYGDNQKGICIKLSIKKYIKYIDSIIIDSNIIPNYYKVNYIQYENNNFDEFLQVVLNGIKELPLDLRNNMYIVWFFLLEYWRNFFKRKDYKREEEIRLVISDNYALFLFIMHLLIKWNIAKSDNPKEISNLFLQEYNNRKQSLYNNFNYNKENNYLTIPLHVVLDSIIIGADSTLTKNDVIKLSKQKIRKSQVKKASKL